MNIEELFNACGNFTYYTTVEIRCNNKMVAIVDNIGGLTQEMLQKPIKKFTFLMKEVCLCHERVLKNESTRVIVIYDNLPNEIIHKGF